MDQLDMCNGVHPCTRPPSRLVNPFNKLRYTNNHQIWFHLQLWCRVFIVIPVVFMSAGSFTLGCLSCCHRTVKTTQFTKMIICIRTGHKLRVSSQILHVERRVHGTLNNKQFTFKLLEVQTWPFVSARWSHCHFKRGNNLHFLVSNVNGRSSNDPRSPGTA